MSGKEADMAMSEALAKAQKKYTKEKTRSICIRLNKETDADVLDKLDAVTNKADYIRELVRKDMEG